MATLYQYGFGEVANLDAVEDILLLATAAAEGLHSSARMSMDVQYWSEPENGAVIIDGGTRAGEDLAAIFTHLLHYALPKQRFSVRRIPDYRPPTPARACRGSCGEAATAKSCSGGRW